MQYIPLKPYFKENLLVLYISYVRAITKTCNTSRGRIKGKCSATNVMLQFTDVWNGKVSCITYKYEVLCTTPIYILTSIPTSHYGTCCIGSVQILQLSQNTYFSYL